MNQHLFAHACARALACVSFLIAGGVYAADINIIPSQDNTIAQGTDPVTLENFEDNSSGACDNVFSGRTNDGLLRRTLLQFDIAGNVPAGSTITGVSLSMTVNRSGDNQDATMTLYPVSIPWGEGTNTCGARGGGQGEPAVTGAATWLDAEFNVTAWSSPGGDFGAASTSAAVASGNGSVGSWSSAAMVSQVQSWLDAPAANAGWILVGDEARTSTTRRFGSRESGTPPVLTISFDPPPGSVACCFADTGSCSVEIDTTACSGAGGVPANPATDSCDPNPCPQPVGVCCNADQSCSELVARDVCETGGGSFQFGVNSCNQVDCGLTPFVDAMPVPPLLQPTGTRGDGVLQYTVSVEEATQNAHSELPNTDLWTYNGAWPGATIVARKGIPIEVTYQNNLPSAGNRGGHILDVDECAHGPNYFSDSPRIVTHLHGGHVPSRVDGQPEYTILPGETDVYEYPNNQDAATTWYHDHALGITRLNVYSGLAGFYLIADSEDTLGTDNAFGFPSGQYEIGMAIQDREFNDDGSLFYSPTIQNAFKGDVITVNGKVWPFLDVDQGKYRFRMLNGSQSREYRLRLENITNPGNDPHFFLVGTDLGLTSAPVDLGNTLPLFAPAERFDVVIDFAGMATGDEIVMRNDELSLPLIPNVMKFVVTGQAGYTGTLSPTLRTVTPLPENSADATRYFRLERVNAPCSNDPGRVIGEWHVTSLDGPGGNEIAGGGHRWDDLTEFPLLGTREIWEFENPTNSPHPMHVHLVRFQILDKTDINTGQPIPLEAHEAGTWKDIVRVPPQSRARIIMDFEDYLGRFPQHCHILDHEDHEMMRQFQTINDPANCVVNGVCDPGEDCQSCPADCAEVSGASCGNGLCEAGDGENCSTCPEDCAGKQKGSTSKQFCCGFDDGQVTNPIGCGVDAADNRCIDSSVNLFCRVEARLRACCGDKLCEGAENISSCGVDCNPNACTPTEPGTEITCNDGEDNDCDGLADAADPDCQACVPDETPEQSCFDGNDNDCDQLADCADTVDCEGAVGPPTTCGVGACQSTGNLTCSGGAGVDTCTPGTPGTEGPSGDASCNDGIDNDCDGDTDAGDADCQAAVDCSQYTTRNECRNEPSNSCKWDNQAGQCVPR